MSPCGIGIQTRDVTCIHEVTHGTGKAVPVPNYMCPQPPPADRRYCNVLDCPVKWSTGEWGKVYVCTCLYKASTISGKKLFVTRKLNSDMNHFPHSMHSLKHERIYSMKELLSKISCICFIRKEIIENFSHSNEIMHEC